MKMGLRRLIVIFVSALLLCVSQPFWLSFPVIFGSSVVVGQTNDARKSEADRLLQQGTQQRQAEQYNAALKSFQQALIIYREIKVSREVKALQGKVLQEIGHAYFQLGDNTKALAPSGKDNGLLTAEEILNFKQKLNADLVVLSACNTGRGRITGDGVIGLSRSLISAGTPSVIVSLWAVPDAPTAELMTEFYKNLPGQAKAT